MKNIIDNLKVTTLVSPFFPTILRDVIPTITRKGRIFTTPYAQWPKLKVVVPPSMNWTYQKTADSIEENGECLILLYSRLKDIPFDQAFEELKKLGEELNKFQIMAVRKRTGNKSKIKQKALELK